MTEKILIVEDDATLREMLEYNLQRQGYAVSTAADGNAALRQARESLPDLVLLDLMLPGIDGLEVCRILRRESQVPILMLTARAEEIDRVLGLELGADDYLTKPFSLRELQARVKALLRRSQITSAAVSPEQFAFGDLVIDNTRRVVLRGGEPLALSPKEYELLLLLARHKGQVLSRELILERVWDWEYAGGTRTVDVHIRWLRAKIERDPAHPQHIVTVRNVGYRLEE
ncbi:MAG: response regulator [Anaerolineae bacterium]